MCAWWWWFGLDGVLVAVRCAPRPPQHAHQPTPPPSRPALQARLFQVLKGLRVRHRVLLTGTPLQVGGWVGSGWARHCRRVGCSVRGG